VRAEGSTVSTLKNVSRPIPRRSMTGWTSLDADSMVNARFSGDSSVTCDLSRTPRWRRYWSSMRVNSTGAGGHLWYERSELVGTRA